MIPKIILLKTGERIISALGEIKDQETDKGICLLFKCPYILTLVQNDEGKYNVNFTKWIPYSTEDQFKIPYDSVIAIGDVEPEILEIYIERFGDKINDGNDGGDAGDNGTSDSSDSAEESGLSDSPD